MQVSYFLIFLLPISFTTALQPLNRPHEMEDIPCNFKRGPNCQEGMICEQLSGANQAQTRKWDGKCVKGGKGTPPPCTRDQYGRVTSCAWKLVLRRSLEIYTHFRDKECDLFPTLNSLILIHKHQSLHFTWQHSFPNRASFARLIIDLATVVLGIRSIGGVLNEAGPWKSPRSSNLQQACDLFRCS